MKAIVVVDQNWAIGNEGKLLIHLPGDLKNFKQVTLGKTVIMGRKTLLSLPGKAPLPGRKNIVLSGDAGLLGDFIRCDSLQKLEEALLEEGGFEEAFVIGGASVYKQLLPCCDEIYVTKIRKAFEKADSYFPNLDEAEDFRLAEVSEPVSENGCIYEFTVYRR